MKEYSIKLFTDWTMAKRKQNKLNCDAFLLGVELLFSIIKLLLKLMQNPLKQKQKT